MRRVTPFSPDAIGAALGSRLSDVQLLDTFAASDAEVVRVRLDGSETTVIAKHATGAGAAAARREIAFYEQLAPRWDHPAPRLLGATDDGESVLLLTEDLNAGGYHAPGPDVSDNQLHGAIDVLAALHREFWNDVPAAELEQSVTSTAQAWPPEVISRNAAAVRAEAARFFDAATELVDAERSILEEIVDGWENQFQARVREGRALTLIHGDFHFLGNVFFKEADPRPKVIDWSELKPGLGPHDLAYALSVVPSDDRPTRDRALLRRYWEALAAEDYSWELCEWDFRFSLISNLFQSVFQHSVRWYRVSLTAIETLDARSTLTDRPPISGG
ncbi:aminoglycoside phosphotransferase family protein [Kribbella kalugense]|uniref:Phosphotransferase family enzyme n=1 Tax=Kribbella kalugense TaxID=2512221 RepID=A0A4R7ZWE9_9ACTN|nr:aminoglycoside phosphotransferase family protein [Kribbella kalugense]TDW22016.1 phosphotransferase family enzyme [Kribbella kalugense]